MRTISEQELKNILDKHGKWLRKYSRCEWKLAKSLDYSYWVSARGQFASAITPALSLRQVPLILKPRRQNNGYAIISFRKRNKLAHRVVAHEFLGDIEGKIVHHKDGNKINNCVTNLEITNSSKNNVGSFSTRNKMYGNFIKSCAELFEMKNPKLRTSGEKGGVNEKS